MIICPNCNYTRSGDDFAPETECPKCGIIYGKFQKEGEWDHVNIATEGSTAPEVVVQRRPYGFIFISILVLSLGVVVFQMNDSSKTDQVQKSKRVAILSDGVDDIEMENSAPESDFSEDIAENETERQIFDAYYLDSKILKKELYIPELLVLEKEYKGYDLYGFYEKYGVRFVIPDRSVAFSKYRCDPPGDELSRYLSETIDILSIYPVSFLEKINLKFVLLCSNLYQGNFRPGGIPNGISGVLVMDISYGASIDSYDNGFHHELYHMVDYADDRSFNDSVWRNLTKNPHVYGNHGKFHRDANTRAGSGKDGFITEYAMSAVSEDKAEIFRFLILDADTLESIAESDPELNKKIERLKKTLITFSPEIEGLL